MPKMIKFYDVKSKKPVMIPEDKTKIVYKRSPRGRKIIKMLTAIGPLGNKLYKIIG